MQKQTDLPLLKTYVVNCGLRGWPSNRASNQLELDPLLWHLELWPSKNNLHQSQHWQSVDFQADFFLSSAFCSYREWRWTALVDLSLITNCYFIVSQFPKPVWNRRFHQELGGIITERRWSKPVRGSVSVFNPVLSSRQSPRHRGGLFSFARHVPDVPLVPNTTPPLQHVHYSPTHVRNHFASRVTGLSFTLQD